MKLPRDIGGEQLARLLARYGYEVVRQTGSHLRLVSTLKGQKHQITIPRHKPLRVGTLHGILKDVASYLGYSRRELVEELFAGDRKD